MQTQYKYLTFVKTDTPNRKTSIWECKNSKSNTTLGIVKWYPSWRQYCYFPIIEAVYSSGCLDDISNFMNQLKEEKL
jgi:hypothetical protein